MASLRSLEVDLDELRARCALLEQALQSRIVGTSSEVRRPFELTGVDRELFVLTSLTPALGGATR